MISKMGHGCPRDWGETARESSQIRLIKARAESSNVTHDNGPPVGLERMAL